MNCSECGVEIPQERLEVLPDTETCVKCSKHDAVVGVMVWNEGTPTLIISSAEEAKELKRLEKFDGRLNRL
jgi:hypothetical protein